MKKIRLAIILVFIILISIIVFFGKGSALDTNFSISDCGCQGMDTIYTCGDTIYDSCVMNCDLAARGSCFTIGADDVIIDGNGFTIYYGYPLSQLPLEDIDPNIPFFAIKNDGFDNILIKDLNIFYSGDLNPGFGIFLNNSENSIIENNKITRGKVGILVMNSLNVSIKHSSVYNMSYGFSTAWDACDPFNTNYNYAWFESGIWLLYSHNGIIYNNTIVGNMTEDDIPTWGHAGTEAGITLCRGNNTNFSSNRIYGVDTYGFHIRNNSSHNIVNYNFINGSNKAGAVNINDGIIIDRSNYNNVSHNTFIKCSEWGIFLGISNYTYVYNNTANHNAMVGIRIGGSSSNNTIKENTANYNGEQITSHAGIRCEGVDNLIIDNTANNNPIGLYFYGYTMTSKNNIVKNLVAQGNEIGVKFQSSDQNLITDSEIKNSNNKDIFSTNVFPNRNVFLNVSFDEESAEITGASNIHIQWYMDAFVEQRNGNPIDNATVIAYDSNNILNFIEVSGSNGYISRQILTEYSQNSTGKNYFTPYNLLANKLGYKPAFTYVYLTGNAIGEDEIVLTLMKQNKILTEK